MKAGRIASQWGKGVSTNLDQLLRRSRSKRLNVPIELFRPERRCPTCHLASGLFVGSRCVHCWSATEHHLNGVNGGRISER
jgi:hypothetical protein